METYLAYFDILGFKDFIYKSSEYEVNFKFECLFRDSQSSITGDSFINNNIGGIIPNLNHSKVSCLHISDSIVFWTNGVGEEHFIKIIDVCNDFFQSCCVHQTFPVRGCIVKGAISFNPFTVGEQKEFKFINSSLYGKALIEAYLKAESQDWAGCYIDSSAFEGIQLSLITELTIMKKLIPYTVPFKNDITSNELTISMIGPKRNNISTNDIQNLFVQMSNGSINPSVQHKINNTIKYYQHVVNEFR